MRLVLVLVMTMGVAACAPKKIPGTDIDDTSDTRAVLDLVDVYRKAVENKNAQAIIELADESFKDDGGTVSPDDDLDYQGLFTELPKRFGKLADVKLDVTVRRIEFNDARTVARVTYSYQVSFKMPEYTGKTQSENDLKQMALKRLDEKRWKITSGI